MKVRHTVPSTETQSIGYFIGAYNSTSTAATWSNLFFGSDYKAETNTQFLPEPWAQLNAFNVSLKIQTNSGAQNTIEGQVCSVFVVVVVVVVVVVFFFVCVCVLW